tara:strand:- start:3536 stop:4573 length:1038 start_codon:yes stop_codon:yes gene_type:complete
MKTKKQFYCHSGGAVGADTLFEKQATLHGIKTLAYSYKTNYHKSPNKVEITELEYEEGKIKIEQASDSLKRKINYKYMPLFARNWQQIKNSDEIFAVSELSFKTTFYVPGGTGWAVQMAIESQKPVFLFNQKVNLWYSWSYTLMEFIILKKAPKITKQNFAGIGTRKLNENGVNAIKQLLEDSFKNQNMEPNKPKEPFEESGWIDSANCFSIKDNLPKEINVVVYTNCTKVYTKSHSKTPNFHVFDGLYAGNATTFNIAFDATKLPNLILLKKVKGNICIENLKLIKNWLQKQSNLYPSEKLKLKNWQAIAINWDAQNAKNTLRNNHKICSFEMNEFLNAFYKSI